MSERIVLGEGCTGNSGGSIQIPLGTTFKVVHHYSPLGYSPMPIVDLSSFDLTAKFWILGNEDKVITFYKPSISDENVIVDKFAQLIKFIFRSYDLQPGKLYCRLEYKLSDPTLPGGWANDQWEGFTGIILT